MKKPFSNFFRVLITGIMVFSMQSVNAQLMDTVKASLKHKPKFFFTLNNFTSLISHEWANFSSIRTGVSYNKRVRFGLGYATLNSNVVSSIMIDNDSQHYETNGELRVKMITISAEYIFYRKYPWQFSAIPFQLGMGPVYYSFVKVPEGGRENTPSEFLVIIQPEVTAQYNFFKWLALGSSVGYRKSLYASSQIQEDFDSPIFSLGIRLFVDEIYNGLFPHGISGKKNRPAEEK